MMTDEPTFAGAALRDMVRRIPHWLRVDLNAIDPMVRERAEGALVAMIASLQDQVAS